MKEFATGRAPVSAFLLFSFLVLFACSEKEAHNHEVIDKSYAIYAEYAKADLLMADGINRRRFDTSEAQHGNNIRLESDGSITLRPGTYAMRGFSLVTMQDSTAPPVPKYNNTYIGYSIVYHKEDENDREKLMKNRIGIGSGATAMYLAPSTFDLIYTCTEEEHICVGHQVGDTLHNEVYFTINNAGGGTTSPYHVFGRIAITEL